MNRVLGVALAVSFASACTGNTGSLDLFAPTGAGGMPDGSACSTASCGTGGSPRASIDAAAPNAPDAAQNHDGASACSTARDCRSGEANLCVAGRCVECAGDDDCTSGDRQHCSDNQCVQCRSDDDCTPDKPGCVVSAGRCDDCSKDSQCESGERCDVDEGKCR